MQVPRRKHETRRSYRPYRFPGQEVGTRLAAWLNGPSRQRWEKWTEKFVRDFGGGISGKAREDAKARARVIEYIGYLQEMTRAHQLICAGPAYPPPVPELVYLRKAAAKANAILRRYISYPQISRNEPCWKGKERHFLHGSRAFVWARSIPTGVTLQEDWAITWAIEKLTRDDVLGRLRRCGMCQRFFFGKRPESLDCGPECRAKRRKQWRQVYDQERKENPDFRIRTNRRSP